MDKNCNAEHALIKVLQKPQQDRASFYTQPKYECKLLKVVALWIDWNRHGNLECLPLDYSVQDIHSMCM